MLLRHISLPWSPIYRWAWLTFLSQKFFPAPVDNTRESQPQTHLTATCCKGLAVLFCLVRENSNYCLLASFTSTDGRVYRSHRLRSHMQKAVRLKINFRGMKVSLVQASIAIECTFGKWFSPHHFGPGMASLRINQFTIEKSWHSGKIRVQLPERKGEMRN